MQMIQGFADGDQAVINQVNLAAHIFGSYLYTLLASIA